MVVLGVGVLRVSEEPLKGPSGRHFLKSEVPLYAICARPEASSQQFGDTTPCKVTLVNLHGVAGVTLRGRRRLKPLL